MHNLDLQVLDRAMQWARDQPIWLCTVLSTYGSSPRPPGAMMVINEAGHYCGSLSGGCIEDNFIGRIRAHEFAADSQLIRYGDGGLTPDQSLPCGGILDILVEKRAPGAATIGYLQQMAKALSGAHTLQKTITIPHACQQLTPCPYASSTIARYDQQTVTLTIAAAPRLLIAGLSVVALFCANFALALGYETIVCESRPEQLENFRAELPEGCTLLEIFPANYLEKEGCHPGTAIVSLTHDPRVDDLTLMEAVQTDAFYIGAMGSAKNSERRLQRLQRIAELSPAQLARIHAPIGLDIASKTPAEIALAVMADIVRLKNTQPSAVAPQPDHAPLAAS